MVFDEPSKQISAQRINKDKSPQAALSFGSSGLLSVYLALHGFRSVCQVCDCLNLT